MDYRRETITSDVALEELRLATVLNGGVSLAVWMGGVAHEINKLTHSEPDAGDHQNSAATYATVLRIARTKAVVDVIAGTSAGGINGGALALAQVNRSANLATLRGLWGDQGRMQSLLRKPFDGQPTSLLRGDEYFLPELSRAMNALAGDFESTGRRVHLTMPVTLLVPTTLETPDAQGHLMRQEVYGGSFRFTLDAAHPGRIKERALAIGLAARTSAGFPFAFEPSYIPVHDHDIAPNELRPAMERWASWAKGFDEDADDLGDTDGPDPGGWPNRSRYAIDGGILANTPTRQALRDIERHQAFGPVRRTMLLVFPHAEQSTLEHSVEATSAPSVTDAALGMFAALRAQGSLSFVEEIDAHNRRVGAWRGGRKDVLRSYPNLGAVYGLVQAGWPAYMKMRERVTADRLASQVRHDGWSFKRVHDQVRLTQERAPGGLPYVPQEPPPSEQSVGDLTGWHWGTDVAVGVLEATIDILSSALSVAIVDSPESPVPEELREERLLRDARESAAELAQSLRDLLRTMGESWRQPLARAMEPTTRYWTARLVSFRMLMGLDDPDSSELGQLLVGLVDELPHDVRALYSDKDVSAWRARLLNNAGEFGARVAEIALASATLLSEPRLNGLLLRIAAQERGRLVELSPWETILRLDRDAGPSEPVDPARRMLARLLALDTATWLVTHPGDHAGGRPIDMVQLDLSVRHRFAEFSQTPDEKAAGLSVGRFGGFLKRSWRLNDWIWGRLDAVQMLCRVVLDPQRLLRIERIVHGGDQPEPSALASYIEEIIAEIDKLYEPHPPDATDPLRRAAQDELMQLFQADAVPPSSLTALAEYAARPMQWRIILEELPFLAMSVKLDGLEGQNRRSRGDRFRLENAELLKQVARLEPTSGDWTTLGATGLAAFDRAGIGRETLAEEAGSDALIKTAASAAAVGITVLDSQNLGVRFLRPVTRVVRGASLLPYWMITGLTRGPGLARSLAITGFALGGLLFVLGVLGALGDWSSAGAAAGAATLLAAFGYAALRTGSLLHGIVLLGPIVPFYAYTVEQSNSRDAVTGALTSVGIVAGLVAGLALLGSLPSPLRTPIAMFMVAVREVWGALGEAFVRLIRWKWWWWVLLVVVAAGLGSAAIWRPERWDRLQGWVIAREPWATVGVAIGLGVLGSLVAYWRGSSMQMWTDDPARKEQSLQQVRHPAFVAGAWAAVYGWFYLGAAGILVWVSDESERPYRAATDWGDHRVLAATTMWTAVLGLVLLLVVPGMITWIARRRFERQLVDDPTLPAIERDTYESDVAALLRRRGLLFRYLVAGIARDTGVRLTGRGRILADRLRREHRRRQKSLLGPSQVKTGRRGSSDYGSTATG